MLKHILQSLFTKGFVAIINFLVLIVSSHYLGVSSRGEIGILILNISIIQVVNEVFTGYTLVYFIPRYDLKKIVVAGIIYTLLACSLSNSVFFVLRDYLKNIHGYEWLSYLISLVVILNTFNCVIILGREKIGVYNFLNMVQPFLLLTGLVVATRVMRIYTFDAYIWPLLFSFVLAFFISSAYVIQLVVKSEKRKDFFLKPIITNGLLCQMAVLMHIFCNRYSFYLLETRADVGLYSSASSLIESVLIISNGIAPVLLARVANDGDNERSRTMTLSLAKASFLLSVFCVAIITLIPESFFIFLLGKGFEGIKEIMLLYSPGILMLSFAGIISHYFSAIGKLRIILLCNSLGFICAMVLIHFLVNSYGIKGAAVSADIAYSVLTISLAVAFFIENKLQPSELMAIGKDYSNLRDLFFRRKHD
jgi:O-antigen/teichoic acid export membrane protein